MLEHVKKQQLLERVKDLFDDAVIYDREWQANANEAFGFRDGWGQWKDEERDILTEERRPALTLNVVKSHIDLIMGLNEDIKKKYVCTPVGKEDGFLCEVLNNTVHWLYQKNEWESEEDNAFESSLISGRGWVAIDFDVDENKMSEIKMTQTSIPIHEVRCDPAARKRDLSDASFIFWDRWLSLEDFAIKYPKHEQKAREAFENGTWPVYSTYDGMEPEFGHTGSDINDESDYSDALDVGYYDSKKKQIRVCHMEYWKYRKKYFVYDLGNGQLRPVDIDWPTFKKRWEEAFPGKKLRYETTTAKEVWWLQFCGDEILFHGKSPIAYPGFSIIPCFVFGDVSRRRGYHYGMVELMKDAQREINKRTSQTLNLYNQQVQPGVYAEAKAFVNSDQAEQSLKESGSVTWLQDGAIGQKRFQERSIPTFPSSVLQMGEYAREMLRHITGINPDLLGMNDKRQEPGIVVQLRQQQGMAILKPVFKAYSSMKKQLFERQVRIIMQYMPATQILKILGEPDRFSINKEGGIVDGKTGLVANFRNVSDAAYDIDAEPETTSMTQNSLELATFMEMQKNGIPVDPRVLVGKTNLPTTEKIRWIEYIDNMQESQSEMSKAEMDLKKAEIEGKNQIELKKLELQAAMAKRKADDQMDKDAMKMAMDEDKLEAQVARDQQTAMIKTIQIATQAKQGNRKLQLEWLDIMLDADFNRKKLILDTAEVLAESQNAQDATAAKAVIEMYRAALQAKTLVKAEEMKLATKVMETLVSAKSDAAQRETDASVAVLDAGVQLSSDRRKSGTELIKTAMQEKSKKDIAEKQAASAEKVAKSQAESAKTVAKSTGDASTATAKATGKATVDAAKATGQAQVDAAKATDKKKKDEKPL